MDSLCRVKISLTVLVGFFYSTFKYKSEVKGVQSKHTTAAWFISIQRSTVQNRGEAFYSLYILFKY
jgi:hypothetical protein